MNVLKEPWIIAAIIGIVFSQIHFRIDYLDQAIDPFTRGCYPLILVYVGANLYPLEGIPNWNQLIPVVTRLMVTLIVAIIAVKLLPIGDMVGKIVILCTLAPAASLDLFMGSGKSSHKREMILGIIVSLAVIKIILNSGWHPWNF